MRNSLFNKKIPTLLGLILLGIGLFTVSYLANTGSLFVTQATPPYAPEQIRITNISDTSFTVSFITDEAVLGTLSYGTNQSLGKLALDDRDQQTGTPRPYQTHHITVKNLTPNSEYFFSITASDKEFLDQDKPFSVRTLSPLSETPPQQSPIVGKVSYPDGSTRSDVIVFLVGDSTQSYSVLSKQDGSYVMPLNSIRTKDFTGYANLKGTDILQMLFVGPTLSSRASLYPTQINPVPLITLSNSYDFTVGETPSIVEETASTSASSVSFPSFEATEVTQNEPQITSPKNEEGLSDQQPSFQGKALPNESVEILIQSSHEISTTVKANANGSWSFRPDQKLEPGEHTVTIKTKDSNGILKTIRRSFTVYAEGSQFTEPSVSPVQTTPTPTIFVEPTPTLTPTPTPTLSITATPSAIPTINEATPTVVPPPSESPGSSSVIISVIIAGIALVMGLFFFSLQGTKKV